jgi:hypothetical protein
MMEVEVFSEPRQRRAAKTAKNNIQSHFIKQKKDLNEPLLEDAWTEDQGDLTNCEMEDARTEDEEQYVSRSQKVKTEPKSEQLRGNDYSTLKFESSSKKPRQRRAENNIQSDFIKQEKCLNDPLLEDAWTEDEKKTKVSQKRLRKRQKGSNLFPRSRLPKQVMSIPPRRKKLYPVPPAPLGVTFVSSQSQQPLRTGKHIDESDDESDLSWVVLRMEAEIDKNDSLPDDVKRFLKGLDPYVWNERIDTDTHFQETIIRFAHDKGAWIWQEAVFDVFVLKINELLEDGLISKDFHRAARDIVENQKPNGYLGGLHGISNN